MKRSIVLALSVLIAVAIPVSAVYGQREEIRLTTIIPDQQVLMVKKGVVGENYRKSAAANPNSIPANSLIVEGNVGIGTLSPANLLALEGSDAGKTIGAGTVGIRLVNTDPSSQGHLTEIHFGGRSQTNKPFAAISAILRSDVGMEQSGDLAFSTKDTLGATYPVERMRISQNGNVGIGTTTPAGRLHIYKGNGLCLDAGTTDGTQLNFITSGNGADDLQNSTTKGWHIYARGNDYSSLPNQKNDLGITFYDGLAALTIMHIDSVTGSVGIGTIAPGYPLDVAGQIRSSAGVCAGSDLRWKEKIAILDDPLQKILRLRGVEFDWKRKDFKENNFPEGRQIGMIAQEVEKEFPQLVTTDGQGYKAVAYDRFTVVLLEAIKTQQEEIQGLKKELKSENDVLKSRIEVLEARLNAK